MSECLDLIELSAGSSLSVVWARVVLLSVQVFGAESRTLSAQLPGVAHVRGRESRKSRNSGMSLFGFESPSRTDWQSEKQHAQQES